jgi:mannosyl-3-phosphoglycerate phosphatase family protein
MTAGSQADQDDATRSGTWLVVSDVDHTLMDHDSEVGTAAECLRQLRQWGVTTLLASSKTFAEMVDLQSRMGVPAQPFIFENGCGIGWPKDQWPETAPAMPTLVLGDYGAIVRGGPADQLRALLNNLRNSTAWRFSLLEDLPFPRIEELLGLDQRLADLALQRLASVPLVWHGDNAELEQLQRRLAHEGLRAVKGGRLVHISPPYNKGEAVNHILEWSEAWSAPLRLLACGDSENDRTLLELADRSLVFHPPDRQPMVLRAQAKTPGVAVCSAGGPLSWFKAVQSALAIDDWNTPAAA